MAKHKPRPGKPRAAKPRKEYRAASAHNALPEMAAVTITHVSEEGDLIAEPVAWDKRKRPPYIVVIESGRQAALGVGDRVLAKLRKVKPHTYQALAIKLLPPEGEARQVLGVFVATHEGGLIEPISRKNKESFLVARADMHEAKPGELVMGVTLPGMPSLRMAYAKITERLGRLDAPRAASLIATHMHELPVLFSKEALAEAEQAPMPVLTADRTDLREIPLVTIDGEDARDFDDAVFAEPDQDGWHLVVAIAEVATYVPEGSALDAEASARGNSVYFPDRVIPMLPERLSNGLCSLNPHEDRYCLAVHLWIDAAGRVKRYQFVRGLMRSRARLTYNQVETMSIFSRREKSGDRHDEGVSTQTIPAGTLPHPGLLPEGEGAELITNLFGAYKALARERNQRGALDLNLPEYKIMFDAEGNVSAIAPRERLEAHRLIEVFMIAANVAAADLLLKHRAPGVFRVHEAPSEEKLDAVRQFLKLSGYNLQKGGIKAAQFNRILQQSEGEPNQVVVHTCILRAQMQAYYSHENLGHFGLSLQKYCHFTSPIRRYADLVVHRALIEIMGSEQRTVDKKNPVHRPLPTVHSLPEIALHISETERRAMLAERDASDRYKVSFMSHQIGNTFAGIINSLNEYGLFVSLKETGVTGFVPVRNLPGDFYIYDKPHACFRGQRSKQVFAIGQPIVIRVQEANAITGSLIFKPEAGEKQMLPLRRKEGKADKRKPQPHKKR